MERQYCKVGKTRTFFNGTNDVAVLQIRYNDFLTKAADLSYADAALREFFAHKASQLKKILENTL
ncbi:MAG: hypothetical protein OER83_02830 [Flavobacteriaceae bacterium]|nr:hypothetical protein [Flavobacteriaceae bacterium]MDH3795787.1 hypothetical protein [Flavobacteriaceae bacterium]